jgi:hypothetical protein
LRSRHCLIDQFWGSGCCRDFIFDAFWLEKA